MPASARVISSPSSVMPLPSSLKRSRFAKSASRLSMTPSRLESSLRSSSKPLAAPFWSPKSSRPLSMRPLPLRSMARKASPPVTKAVVAGLPVCLMGPYPLQAYSPFILIP